MKITYQKAVAITPQRVSFRQVQEHRVDSYKIPQPTVETKGG